ncbi:MAG: 2-hydroxyacid dehydrogenase [Anaerolineaceae bacterium]|nr:2-hydroxyacid dehydrogenase [Anaerolineaceae bacterium]
MSINVHLLRALRSEADEKLRSLLDDNVKLTSGGDFSHPADFHILVEGRPERSDLEACPNLRALIIPYAGLSDSTRDIMGEFPQVSVHNLHHNAIPTAEMAISLMLAAAKNIVFYDRPFRENDWTRRYQQNPSVLLYGKTVLILGYGKIGQHVARVSQGMGMKVLAFRRQARKENDTGVEVYGPEELMGILPQAQFLVIALPLTPETNGMIGAQEIARMPKGSVLVNVGRGPVVDQEALFNALKGGHLNSAGLDVWYNYPQNEESRQNTPPSDFPFNELENVILSPHRGGEGGTLDVELLRVQHLAGLLNAAARGEPIPNKVDLQIGY